ncbi:unnamed protein product [Symbiodinium pilosum]|uniref:SAM domain-containing protein n=1 Tax=Symbiodinium pilosum TaxID=2952 RepID=A0A812IQB8_SYMPI|nr:unnamed protein product [Symbiodinium pilosum]
MKLQPCDRNESFCWDDIGWHEKPGYPPLEGCWIHIPCKESDLPEIFFCEDHDKTRDEPPPVICFGSGRDSHVQLDARFPQRLCRMTKIQRQGWSLEALTPRWQVHLQRAHGPCETLDVGQPKHLRDGDVIGFSMPLVASTSFRFHSEMLEAKEALPNRYPARFPCRSSLPEAPEAPEELRRLAWQTDQMRRRSEQDQVRVADWSNFSQYVKQHYSKHGIDCISWKLTRNKPCDPKPASFTSRQLPPWICELLVNERPLQGLCRELPFASCLRASGHSPLLPEAVSMETSRVSVADESVVPEAMPSQADIVANEVNPLLLQPIYDWLESVDDSGFLLQYYDQIVANFDSLKQIHDVYFHDGHLEEHFFSAAGVSKLGHKRILQKWFREHFT